MEAKLTREQANELLHKYVKGENYITHSYAVEAIMRGLAEKLAPDDVEYWGICGLLHDLDEETAPWREDFGTHGPVSAKILQDIRGIALAERTKKKSFGFDRAHCCLT